MRTREENNRRNKSREEEWGRRGEYKKNETYK
jgi:hypothetical protein